MNKIGPIRTYLEASLPAWLLLAGLLWRVGGQGDLGLLGLAAFAFPGLRAAYRLRPWQGSANRRVGMSLAFAGLLAAGLLGVASATAAAARAFGGSPGSGSQNSVVTAFLLVCATTALPFLAWRGVLALPALMRRASGRGRMARAALRAVAGLLALALAAVGLYWLFSGPYAAHARGPAVEVLSADPVIVAGAAWRSTDAALSTLADASAVTARFDPAGQPGPGYFSLGLALSPGQVAQGDGLRLRLQTNAELYLALRLEAEDGSAYEAEAALTPGDPQAVTFAPFIPALSAASPDGGLAWDQIVSVTLFAYPPVTQTTPVELRVGAIEVVTLRAAAWTEGRSDHFLVLHQPQDEAAAQRLLGVLEERYPTLAAVVGAAPAGRIPILLASDHAELERLQGQQLATWMVGGTLRGSVALLSPRRYSPVYNGKRYADIDAVATHEVAHLMTNLVVGYRGMYALPVWLHEGVAVYLAGQDADQAAGLQRAALDGQLPALAQLADEAGFRQQARWAYPMAGAVVRYLAEAHGADGLARVLGLVGEGATAEAALEAVYGKGMEALEADWRQALVVAAG